MIEVKIKFPLLFISQSIKYVVCFMIPKWIDKYQVMTDNPWLELQILFLGRVDSLRPTPISTSRHIDSIFFLFVISSMFYNFIERDLPIENGDD